MSSPSALLISGVYGAGKSSVLAEIAGILEGQGAAFAAIDLDWLGWFNVPAGIETEDTMVLRNLRTVIANYADAGVGAYVLAKAVGDEAQLNGLRGALAMPLTVVRLVVPRAEIVRRLEADPTSGRRDDLRVAEAWLASDRGVGLEDFTIENVGDIRSVALEILSRVTLTTG